MSEILLEKPKNIRDLGGIETRDGRRIKARKLIPQRPSQRDHRCGCRDLVRKLSVTHDHRFA